MCEREGDGIMVIVYNPCVKGREFGIMVIVYNPCVKGREFGIMVIVYNPCVKRRKLVSWLLYITRVWKGGS